jgi:hypothetical protein
MNNDQNTNQPIMPNPDESQTPEDIFASVDPAQIPAQGASQSLPPGTAPPANPTPSQPETVPPQLQATNQNATGLETQPVLNENYIPEPTYQQAAVPQKSPFKKLLIAIFIIIFLGSGAVFFLFFFNKGTLALNVTPREALIVIDGKNYPKKVDYKIKLPSGDHILEVQLDGYVNYQNKINIKSFKTTTLKIELKSIPVAQKLLDEKMEFIGFSPDKKYLVGLGNAGKTFYRVPLANAADENQKETAQNDQKNTTGDNLTSVQTAQPITEKAFANIVNVIWNSKKELAILKIKNEKSAIKNTEFYKADVGEGIITTWLYDFNRYDLKNQESTYLGEDIGDIVWIADGTKIIYFSKTNKSLYQASPKNAGAELLKNIREISDPTISIAPDGKFLSLIPRSSKYDKNYLYTFDLYSKTAKPLTKKGNQKGAIFNNVSDKILYSTYSEEPNSNIYTSLSLIDTNGEGDQSLDVRALIENVIFFDDKNFIYPASEDQTRGEKLIKYNLETKKEVEFQFQTPDRLRFNNLLLTEDKQKIYFLSDNFLYSLGLITNQY